MQARDENLTLAGYIELDEAFFGGRSKSRGKRKPPSDNKKTILVLVENEGSRAGNLVMKVIESTNYYDIAPVIESKIDSETGGQWFRSDAWGAHHVVMQFGHQINMARVFDQDNDLRCVSLAISLAKRFFKGTYHHFCKQHMQRYLDEFCYRFNRRDKFGELPLHLLTASILHGSAQYSKVALSKQPA